MNEYLWPVLLAGQLLGLGLALWAGYMAGINRNAQQRNHLYDALQLHIMHWEAKGPDDAKRKIRQLLGYDPF